jgi:serine/threonine protein kinase
MTTSTRVAEFLHLITRCKVVDDESIVDYMQQLISVPTTPDLLAEQMIGDGLLTRFQANQLLNGKRFRFFFGPYKILDQLDRGSTGAVYLGEHQKTRQKVAIKILSGADANNAPWLQRLQRQVRAATSLRHLHLAQVFELVKEDQLQYLVMEYIDGVTLQDLIRGSGPFAPRQLAEYLRQAASGLQCLHEAGLVHWAITPSNLMIDQNHVVKLLAPGIKRTTPESSPLNEEDSRLVDHREDLRKLAAAFSTCLPESSSSPKSLTDSPTQASTPVGEDDLQRVLQLLRRLLSADAGGLTAAEVVAEVDSWQWAEEGGNQSGSRAGRQSKRGLCGRVAVWGLTGALLASALAGGLCYFSFPQPKRTSPRPKEGPQVIRRVSPLLP